MTDAIPMLAAATAAAALSSLVLGVLSFVAVRGERRRRTAGAVPGARFFVRYTLPEDEPSGS